MKEENAIGLIPTLMQPANVIEYNPEKFWKENTWESIFKDLAVMAEQYRKRKEETGWKSEYILSAAEAEASTYQHLEWLCSNFRVLCGLEAYQISQNKKP